MAGNPFAVAVLRHAKHLPMAHWRGYVGAALPPLTKSDRRCYRLGGEGMHHLNPRLKVLIHYASVGTMNVVQEL